MTTTAPTNQDVILITIDSLRADYVFDGSEVRDELPTLKSLSQTGATFTNAFSNAGYTKSSFLSIFSGTYPWMFESVSGGFGPERLHVAELFSDAGYITGGFHSNPYLSPDYGYDRGFNYYMGRGTESDIDKTTLSSKVWQGVIQQIGIDWLSQAVRNLYRTAGSSLGVQVGGDPYIDAEAINDSVVRWVSQTEGPRFLWIHYMDVHTPYYPHEGTVSEDISKRHAVKLFHRVDEQRDEASEQDLKLLRRLYHGELEYLDNCLGELFENLDNHLNLDEATLVFSSDHGEGFNEHGHVFHPDGVMYDELVHIPLLVNGPEVEARTIDAPVSNVDIVPTLLSGAGISVPDACVGRDLRDIATDPPNRRFVFTEGYTEVDGTAMVTSGPYKLIRELSDGTHTLYDRRRDPDEQQNRLDEEPAVRDELSKALDAHIEMTRDHTGEARDVDVSDDVKDRLQRLGYTD